MAIPIVKVPGSGAANVGSSIQELTMEPPLARALRKALDDARGRASVAGNVASGGKFPAIGDADSLEIIELHQNPHRVEVKIHATFQCNALPAKKASPALALKTKKSRHKRKKR